MCIRDRWGSWQIGPPLWAEHVRPMNLERILPHADWYNPRPADAPVGDWHYSGYGSVVESTPATALVRLSNPSPREMRACVELHFRAHGSGEAAETLEGCARLPPRTQEVPVEVSAALFEPGYYDSWLSVEVVDCLLYTSPSPRDS